MKPEILQRIHVDIDVSQADLIALGNSHGIAIATRDDAKRFVQNLATISFKKLRAGAHLEKPKGEDGK